MQRFIFIIILFTGVCCSAQAQVKRPLTIDGFASWKTLENPRISNNGKIVAYEVKPERGDGFLVIHRANREDTIARGADAQISPDNDFVIFKIKQPEEVIRKAKRDKVKKEDMPGDSLGIFIFRHDSTVVFPNLIDWKIPEENAGWIAVMLKRTDRKDSVRGGINKTDSVKQPGNNLVLFNVRNADTLTFHRVTEYSYSKKGSSICFISEENNVLREFSRIRYFNTGMGSTATVFFGPGWSEKLSLDDEGGQFAFMNSTDTTETKAYRLYYGILAGAYPDVVADSHTEGMPVGWSPSVNGNIFFSEDGQKLYFGTAETPEQEPKDTLPDEDKPKVDVWNWKDLTLQPQQLVNLRKEEKRTFLGVYKIGEKEFTQLADIHIRNVSIIQKGNSDIALGSDELPYLRASGWTGKNNRDYYLLDTESGIKRQMLKNKSFARLSPAGKYVIWYEDSDSSYYVKSTDIKQLQAVPLTKIIPVPFYDEQNDTPSDPIPYGIAGWAENDRFVFIYDRYDIWRLDPTGVRVPVNITRAFGRRNKTRLRYIKTDPDEEFIPLDKPILLQAFDERTMSSGFFSTSLNSVKDPDLLLVDKYSFSVPLKARNADKLIWTKQDVKTFPDLWYSNLNFGNPVRISNVNPQQGQYLWASTGLIEWTSFTGETLHGLLYKPENFDPAKKYPMIVYYYERSSESLNRYYVPSPSRSTINKTFYASNGYLVFVPDITYRIGYPGQSCYDAVVSGVSNLADKYPFVDRERIGLQGQSWGGYETAYLITQTEMFAAAMAGAPVSNMTSAYGGIRWESGLSRMFQYEHTQSRIGGSLWDKTLLYIQNSPLFFAPKVQTPLLIMHNDHDGAVPWYQGIEMFVALRRLNKPVWMLNYNGEPHNLRESSWADRIDLSKRMFQFFNHYLKGEPMPEWMFKGVPATEKGKDLGY